MATTCKSLGSIGSEEETLYGELILDQQSDYGKFKDSASSLVAKVPTPIPGSSGGLGGSNQTSKLELQFRMWHEAPFGHNSNLNQSCYQFFREVFQALPNTSVVKANFSVVYANINYTGSTHRDCFVPIEVKFRHKTLPGDDPATWEHWRMLRYLIMQQQGCLAHLFFFILNIYGVNTELHHCVLSAPSIDSSLQGNFHSSREFGARHSHSSIARTVPPKLPKCSITWGDFTVSIDGPLYVVVQKSMTMDLITESINIGSLISTVNVPESFLSKTSSQVKESRSMLLSLPTALSMYEAAFTELIGCYEGQTHGATGETYRTKHLALKQTARRLTDLYNATKQSISELETRTTQPVASAVKPCMRMGAGGSAVALCAGGISIAVTGGVVAVPASMVFVVGGVGLLVGSGLYWLRLRLRLAAMRKLKSQGDIKYERALLALQEMIEAGMVRWLRDIDGISPATLGNRTGDFKALLARRGIDAKYSYNPQYLDQLEDSGLESFFAANAAVLAWSREVNAKFKSN